MGVTWSSKCLALFVALHIGELLFILYFIWVHSFKFFIINY